MFGFSFSELVVVVIVTLLVMGPKDLPKMLRRVGQWSGKIRRAAADLRAQSGIDDALRTEGLADDLAEIRKLARGELDAVQRAATLEERAAYTPSSGSQEGYGRGDDFHVVRDREYPRDCADTYGCLPDDSVVYQDSLPKSRHARSPLYVLGDENGELPPDPDFPADHDAPVAAAETADTQPGVPPADTQPGIAPDDAARATDPPAVEPEPVAGVAGDTGSSRHRAPEPTLLGLAPPADDPVEAP